MIGSLLRPATGAPQSARKAGLADVFDRLSSLPGGTRAFTGAVCNMAELAGGLMTEVSIPSGHRWIPKGMTVEHLAKARGDLRAIASMEEQAQR